ncbi:uncharacterized protein LOC141831085 [Curcuma longa]|uniref:uncharacterized protein LOC141831085 n=1 Tax=Curcuma longa TaxID=136217 RepID=UPI003D9E412C
MSGLIWNVRGVGNNATVRRLLYLKKMHRLNFMGILEPLISLDVGFMTRRLSFDYAVSNCSGKIWFLCDQNIECTVLIDHDQFMHLKLNSPLYPECLFVSVVYAKCDCNGRKELWERLLEARPAMDELWMVGGDFNVITGPGEHSAGVLAKPGAVRDFNNFIMMAGLLDAGFVGDTYTWTNNRVWKRLDRVILSPSWGAKDFGVKVEHLSRATSDHCPLLLSFPAFGRPKSSFRFQNMWTRHDGFLLTVRLNWLLPCQGTGMKRLQIKLKRLKNHLKWWNAEVFGNIQEKVQRTESDFALAEKRFDSNPTVENRVQMAQSQAQLNKILYMEEDFWKQKAAVRWMGEGDRNTKFFHHLAQKRRLSGRIYRIWEDGVCLEKPELIQASGAVFFEKLLAEDTTALLPASMENIPRMIKDEENSSLSAIPTIEEVRQVILTMSTESAAGPDGFSVSFYVTCWEIIKSDVYEAVVDFFRGSPFPRGMAATTIVLIPKIEGAQRWQDFRPISLCNVSNKIISKLIANRLGKVLDAIISPTQSGFVAGRNISDNILLAQELYHKMNYHIRGGNLILKLDMAKAYDRIQWEFLFQIMEAFGFTEPVIDMVLLPPKTILHQLEMICANFFWGSSASKGKAHWISWQSICTPKLEGGLGVRRLLEVATAISLKLWWRFRAQNTSWAKYLVRQYCGAMSPVIAPLKGNASPTWKRMVHVRVLAESQIGWTVGDGRLSFWYDGWLDRGPLFRSCEVVGNQEALVADFREENCWNGGCLRAVLPADVAAEVADCSVQPTGIPLMIWKASPKGVFSLKSAWQCARDRRQIIDMGSAIWSKLLLPKISIFIWRFLLERLPVDSILQHRGVSLASKCQFCGEVESWRHLFFRCQVAMEVWSYFASLFRVTEFTNITKWRVGNNWLKQGHIREAFPFLILWFMWVARNDAKHRDIKWSAQQIIRKIVQYVIDGMSAGLIKDWHWKGVSMAARSFGLKVQLQTVNHIYVVRWQKPRVGTYKLNSDGCSRGNPGMSSFGFLVRDHDGRVIKAMHGSLGVGSNIRAELLAIWKDLELCVANNFLPLWLESDSLAALNIIDAPYSGWELRFPVLNIQEVVRQFKVRCTHTYREANMAADYLANKAFDLDGVHLLDGDSNDRRLFGICKLDRLGMPYIRIVSLVDSMEFVEAKCAVKGGDSKDALPRILLLEIISKWMLWKMLMVGKIQVFKLMFGTVFKLMVFKLMIVVGISGMKWEGTYGWK